MAVMGVKCSLPKMVSWLSALICLQTRTQMFTEWIVKEMETWSLLLYVLQWNIYHQEYFVDLGSESRNPVVKAVYDGNGRSSSSCFKLCILQYFSQALMPSELFSCTQGSFIIC